MTIALQSLALLIAGFGLFALWRAIPDGRMRAIAAAGAAIRALGGAAAFLVSFFDLPIFRSLHFGNGFWFYALDGMTYYEMASRAAAGGIVDIWLLDRRLSSVSFTQAFAGATLLFGSTPAVGLLLNLASYLGCAYLVARWATEIGNARGGALALAALSFGPMTILWTTQPLKDAFFLFLVALYLYALERWRRFGSERNERTLLLSLLMMIPAIYGLAGIRWYFAFIAWGASALFFVHQARSAMPGRRVLVSALSIVPFILSANAIVWSADAYISATARKWIAPFVVGVEAPPVSRGFSREVTSARRGFETSPGATQFDPSGLLAGVPGGKLIAGTAMLVLPSEIASGTRLVRIATREGAFWVAADLDTLFFDAVLLIAIATIATRWRRLADPMVVYLVVLTAGVAFPLAYVVNNFGTLIRLRAMVLIGLALIPLACHPERSEGPPSR